MTLLLLDWNHHPRNCYLISLDSLGEECSSGSLVFIYEAVVFCSFYFMCLNVIYCLCVCLRTTWTQCLKAVSDSLGLELQMVAPSIWLLRLKHRFSVRVVSVPNWSRRKGVLTLYMVILHSKLHTNLFHKLIISFN